MTRTKSIPRTPPRVAANRQGLPFAASRQDMHYTPWLLVRSDAGDTGARPLPSGSVFWESPDIWTESALGINQPAVGQPNQVFARVTNLGWQCAMGVTVKFWWADPSAAITETTAHLIGVGSADIPSGWSVVVECPTPWVPILKNGGHECLIAEAYIGETPNIPFSDPLTAPMDPVSDRHVGQKNEQLITLSPGQSFTAPIGVLNVFSIPLPLTIEVRPLHLTTIHPLLRARVGLVRAELQPPSSELSLSLRLSDAPGVVTRPSTLFAGRLLSMAQQEFAGKSVDAVAPTQVTHTEQFEPWESRTIKVTGQIPPGAIPGQTYGFRVIQRFGRMIAGGYTVNVVVVER